MPIDRVMLHNELHARPSVYFDAPAIVFHLAFLVEQNKRDLIFQRLHSELLGGAVSSFASHGTATFDGYQLKWERHTEFVTLTAVRSLAGESASWQVLPEPIRRFAERHSESLVNACQVLVVDDGADVAQFGFKDPAGSAIGGGDGSVWSDFRLGADGYNRLVLINRRLNDYRLGRMVRRLLEMETYRMMALVSLPLAQQVALQVTEFEGELNELSERTAQLGQGDAQHLLHDIARLSTRVTHAKTKHANRFAATSAYAELVFERIRELREQHAGDCQRLGVFIERRFKPSVRFCSSTGERLEKLAQSVSNLGGLLQARAQVELEAQNSQILQSLNARTQTQIKIQKAVEGLSSVAIAYYFIGLLKFIYQGGETLGLHLAPTLAIVIGATMTVVFIYSVKQKVRKASR